MLHAISNILYCFLICSLIFYIFCCSLSICGNFYYSLLSLSLTLSLSFGFIIISIQSTTVYGKKVILKSMKYRFSHLRKKVEKKWTLKAQFLFSHHTTHIIIWELQQSLHVNSTFLFCCCAVLRFLKDFSFSSHSQFARDLIYVRVKLIFLNVQNNLLSHMRELFFALYNSLLLFETSFLCIFFFCVCSASNELCCVLWIASIFIILFRMKNWAEELKKYQKKKRRWKCFNTRTNLIKQKFDVSGVEWVEWVLELGG